MDAYAEACVLPVTADGAPIAFSMFDPSEELIWSVSSTGWLYSHLLPTVEPYSAFRVDQTGSPPVGFFPNPYGVIALTHDAVHFFAKGGLKQGEVRLDTLQGCTCGCLLPSTSSSRLAVVHALEPQKPMLSLLDLDSGSVATSLALDAPATIARYDLQSYLLCLSGTDGTVRTYDLRAGGCKAVGRCALYPHKANVVCDFDVAGASLCACALRSQLGPLGSQEFVFDTTLRALDLRSMRPTADVFFAQGAMRVRWFFGDGYGGPKILAASGSGELHLLEARGGMSAPSSTAFSMSERGEQLCTLDVSSTGQMICAGGSSGALSICALSAVPVESLQANPYAQQPELPDMHDQPEPLPLDAPIGHLPMPELAEGESLASSWPQELLGDKGQRYVEPEDHLHRLGLHVDRYVSFGTVSAAVYRNTVGVRPNQRLPRLQPTAARKQAPAPVEDEVARVLPAKFAGLRRMVVPLGKFGLADDFSFSAHNATHTLCSLDNTVPNCYCNVALLILYMLPWTRVHCLSSLMKSQFVLSDELGFLYHMMDRSRGSACQPRNFQRALHQSREATALKLVDAVDLEGNVQAASEGLPQVINKFCSFLLEHLSKEAREASREASALASAREEAAKREAAKRERDVLVGAVTSAEGKRGKEDKMSLDALVARAYAERLAQPPLASAPAAASGGSAPGPTGGGAAGPTVFDDVFGSTWEETSLFSGVNHATSKPILPVTREVRSLVLPLTLPPADSEEAAASRRQQSEAAACGAAGASSEGGMAPAVEPGSFLQALGYCVGKESSTRTWCAELGKYRQAKVVKQMRSAPKAMWLGTSQLPEATMEQWEASHGGQPWLPDQFYLSLCAQGSAAAAPADGASQPPTTVEGSPTDSAAGSDAERAKSSAPLSSHSEALHVSRRPVVSSEPPAVADPQGGERRVHKYRLRALVSFSQSLLAHASAGSGHLVLYFRTPTALANASSEAGSHAEAEQLAHSLTKLAIDAALRTAEAGGFAGGDADVNESSLGDAKRMIASPGEQEATTSADETPQITPCVEPNQLAASFDGEYQWYMWNDFSLQPVQESQVRVAHSEWKRPCVALYTVDGIGSALSHLTLTPSSPVETANQLSTDFSLMAAPQAQAKDRVPTFTPLNAAEFPPASGTLVAIDAEFVAVTQEVTRVDGRGRTIVIKPARLALARVSCVRGEGPMAGVPLIDSYIQQAEPVIDYLTRFSGLQPGDLDPSISRHHIETMKSAYVKLRRLIDAGCRFVGHGLKTDFEMINVVIPKAQIIDTVDLFWLEGQRRISLRFLAWHILGQQMANRMHNVHDSIEDARTALALYNKYMEMQMDGTFKETLEQLYDIGYETHWEVPDIFPEAAFPDMS